MQDYEYTPAQSMRDAQLKFLTCGSITPHLSFQADDTHAANLHQPEHTNQFTRDRMTN